MVVLNIAYTNVHNRHMSQHIFFIIRKGGVAIYITKDITHNACWTKFMKNVYLRS